MKNQKIPSPLVGSDRYYLSEHESLEFSYAKNFEVFDQHGNAYTDFVCGMGPVILGHAHSKFNDELTRVIAKGLSFPGYGSAHTDLSECIETYQPNMRVVSLFKTSSEAVTAAIRCAMIKTNRKHIIRCGFLGWHDVQIFSTPSWHEPLESPKRNALRFLEGFRGVTESESVHNWEDLNLSSLEILLSKYGDNTAAFAIDIYQLAFMDEATFSSAVNLCKKYGIQIIYDETKTAGRLCPVGYLQNFPIQPDYYILGKAIANGMPLSILLGDDSNIEIYRKARIGGTHTKDVLSASAAKITIDIMHKENGYKTISRIGKNICSAFNVAATAANVHSLVKAQYFFEGALFDIQYGQSLVNDTARRLSLKRSFFNNKILLLDGHCSFVNLAHALMDFDILSERFYKGMVDWAVQ